MRIRRSARLRALLWVASLLASSSQAVQGVFVDPAAIDPQGQFQSDELLVRLQGTAAFSMARVPAGRSSSALWPAAFRHRSVMHVQPVFAASGASPQSFAPRAPDDRERALRNVFLLELEPGSDVRSLAAELAAQFRATSGPAIERPGDLAALLSNLEAGDVLFIDEIHRLSPAVEEILYPAMEDFQLDLMIGQGPGAHSIRLDLPRFTLVGATTRAGLLTSVHVFEPAGGSGAGALPAARTRPSPLCHGRRP